MAARIRLLALSLTTCAVFLALLAPAALARNVNPGEGTYGETDDKVVTNAGFMVIAFFPLLVFVLSVAQHKLEKRKDERLAAQQSRAQSADWRGGW